MLVHRYHGTIWGRGRRGTRKKTKEEEEEEEQEDAVEEWRRRMDTGVGDAGLRFDWPTAQAQRALSIQIIKWD